MTLNDPNSGFKVTVYLLVEYMKWCFLGTKLLENTNRKPYQVIGLGHKSIVPLSMTLTDFWQGFKVGIFFDTEYLNDTW